MVFQVFQVQRVFLVSHSGLFVENVIDVFILCVGDVGEPGAHGGFSQPGLKGEIGEPGTVGLPGIKGLPGDSGLCTY